VDLARGAPLIGSSVAGYSLAEGARYYGIGNELMGTMMGATLVGIGLALSTAKVSPRRAGVWAGVVYALVFLFIGAPSLGAKVGGALAMAPAAIVALLARRGRRPGWRGVTLVAVLTIVVVGGMFALDSIRGGSSQSHMGRVVGLAASGDASGVFTLFERKIALNFMLLSTSLWSRLLGLSLAASAALFWWGRRTRGAEFLTREKAAAASGAVVGTVCAFAFNDSGVLAAAACAVLLWSMIAVEIMLESDPTIPRAHNSSGSGW